jgi:hypothetical protein
MEMLEVALNVYDLLGPLGISTGAYHTAVEVGEDEWSFGGGTGQESGIYACRPRAWRNGRFSLQVPLGTVVLPRISLVNLIMEMGKVFVGNSYDLRNRNCVHFCLAFAQSLRVDTTAIAPFLPASYLVAIGEFLLSTPCILNAPARKEWREARLAAYTRLASKSQNYSVSVCQICLIEGGELVSPCRCNARVHVDCMLSLYRSRARSDKRHWSDMHCPYCRSPPRPLGCAASTGIGSRCCGSLGGCFWKTEIRDSGRERQSANAS